MNDDAQRHPEPPPRRGGPLRIAGLAALGLAGLLAAVTRLSITGHWYGLYLLHAQVGVGLELKDDLFLGDGSRLVAGVSLARLRHRAGPPAGAPGQASLALEWDAATGSGLLRNHLADGTELVTLFSRYEDSEGLVPHGLFVGGALPDVAADPGQQSESGMTFRDARGWSHVWCNVNEAIRVEDSDHMSYPGRWRFLGSRVLIREPDRVVLESSHEISEGGRLLRMDRFAYFHAGEPYFRLGIRLVNAGDVPARYGYVYGDEPWVGEFGSSLGNVGWLASGVVRREGFVDPGQNWYAGILDEKSGVADFIAWLGDDLPDRVYFSNVGGVVDTSGPPLASNEIFIGVEWRERVLAPGEARSMLLAVGMAAHGPDGGPALPAGIVRRR